MTICDFSCSGPTLLKVAKKNFPNAKLFAYNSEHPIGLKLKRILEKELDDNVNIIEEMKDNIKFDKIIMNPPYDKNLHLKILREAMKHIEKEGGEIVNLSPVRWLQDPLAEYKRGSDWHKFEDIRRHISTLDIISANDSGKLFNIELKVDLGVYYITNDTKENKDLFRNSIVDKVISSGSYGIPYSENSKKEKKYGCLLTLITGGHDGFDSTFSDCSLIKNEKTYGKWFINGKSEMNGLTLAECKAANKRSVNGDVTKWPFVWFDSEEEVKNFYNFTWTKFFRYCLKKMTVDVNVHPQFLPFLPTYKKQWDDKQLYEYFNLTPEERKIIEEEMKMKH